MSDEARPNSADRRPANVLGIFEAVIETAAVGAFAAMMLATLLQVAVRYLQVPIDWTEELARTLFLCAIMPGIALAIPRREHIVVDFIYASRKPRTQAKLSILFDLATLVLLFTWLRGALHLMELNAGATFVMLPWFPVSVLYGIEAAAVALMIFFVLVDLVQRTRKLVKPDVRS